MIKKAGVFLLVLLAVFLISPALAQVEDQLEDTLKDLEEKRDQAKGIIKGGNASDYLSKAWTEQIQKNAPWIYKANPLFKFLFAYEFELSWAFLAAFLLWAIQFSLYYPAMRMFIDETFTAFGISVVVAALTSQVVVPRAIDALSNIVKNFLGSIFTIIGLIMIIVAVGIIWNHFTKKWRAHKETKKDEKRDKELKRVKDIREGMESVKTGFFKGSQ